jgi:D-allulose-6-phosphate 3-epimerase
MCMDLAKFAEQIRFFNAKADCLHVDIMDGHYVPALALSPDFISSVARFATIPIDAHLMMEAPARFVDQMTAAGATTIVCHPETIITEAFRLLQRMAEKGARLGVALNPETGIDAARYYLEAVAKITVMTVDPGFAGQKFIPSMLKKIEALRELKEKNGCSFQIEVDGSCKARTFRDLANAGTEAFVVGTSGLFSLDPDVARAWEKMEADFQRAL